ncbi:Radial spoke head protein 3 [Orchesella cincta]|uniref:Radial spoke head protein 3 n=1 Tax=Orchesella cincta TaxID=48709 RepID=A0A1D2MJN1_ORCCI|nr:Radial spoke head protein 3 [Orchesella cincta]
MPRNPIDQIVRLREYPSEQKDAIPHSPNLFVYCSTPRPVLDPEVSGGPYGRPLYRDNVPKPTGIHSYYNISWDPRVRRGDPLEVRKRKEQLECEKIRRKLTEPRKRTERSISRNQHRNERLSDPQAMIRAANMRYARLAISNLRPKEKDAFLVELTDELDQDEICYKGQRIGAAKELPKVPSRKRNLLDKASQVLPGEFFDFDREVVPVVERLVGAVCYQARMEVLEETELEALKLERELFREEKLREERELLKFKTRVERHITEEERQAALARQQTKDEAAGKISVSLFAGVHVKYGTDEGLRALGDDWELTEKIRQGVERQFTGWLNEEVDAKLTLYKNSTKLLDDIIRRVICEREAQCAASMWKEVYTEEPMRVFSGEMDSNIVPPPTPGTSEYTTDEEHEDKADPRENSVLTTPNFYFANEYDVTE